MLDSIISYPDKLDPIDPEAIFLMYSYVNETYSFNKCEIQLCLFF